MDDRVHLPKVTFKYVPGDTEFDRKERYAFWDSPNTISWLKCHGYTLYRRWEPDMQETYPVLPFDAFAEAHYPYAYYDTESHREDMRLRAVDESGKVAFAQDSLGRHVAIKLVRSETDEYRILQFLRTQSMDTLKENCVIPVLDILHIEGFCFVVMPRWGSNVYLPWDSVRYLHEAITMMRSTLKGLAFLHENGIAHHDILMRNVLVNHFSDVYRLVSSNKTRPQLRSNGCLTYALFDFDHSVLLPPGMKKGEFRLPYQRSWGDFNQCNDTSAGEFDYDPFVFDVGTLGVEFCTFFQNLTFRFPKLAPLFDMMTTRHLDRRFTASQALQFLEEATSELSEHQLNARIKILDNHTTYLEYDRWRGLPLAFVEKWRHYKETPVPWYTTALRRACRRRYLSSIIRWTRWCSHRLFSPFRIVQSSVIPRIVDLLSISLMARLVSVPRIFLPWLSLSREGLASN